MPEPYDALHVYYGDLHSHSAIGYGHGSAEDAFHNARLQLDFACLTPHGWWHDIPADEPRLAAVVDYHRQGFARAAQQWEHLKEMARQNHQDGAFVTFLGYEWHSCRYGDHNIYFKGDEGEIIRAEDMDALRAALRAYRARGIEAMLVPHHIGYKAGYRGINWAEVKPEFIHLVEIMSMHGASESEIIPNRYLHTMGPLDWQSSLHYGLAQGHIVGVIGSTDHHSAHPGSYGHGRVAVWATALTRDGIWDALTARRTVALTGDRIALQFALNGAPMGALLPPASERRIEVAVSGGDALDTVEVLHNNRVIHRWTPPIPPAEPALPGVFKVHLELGWGERGENVDWRVDLRVVGGDLLGVEPRLRGHEIVAPQADEEASYAFSDWQRVGADGVSLTTRTWGNPTTTTPATQGMCFEVRGGQSTRFVGTINGRAVDVRLADLLAGPRAHYLGGFLTPVYYFHRAVPLHEATARFTLTDSARSDRRDWYYVRVRQQNGHWAWSSPIWVERS